MYTLREAIEYGIVNPRDRVRIRVESSGTEVEGVYENPYPVLILGNNSKFRLYMSDLVISVNGKKLTK